LPKLAIHFILWLYFLEPYVEEKLTEKAFLGMRCTYYEFDMDKLRWFSTVQREM
jgi:hypothetical protein